MKYKIHYWLSNGSLAHYTVYDFNEIADTHRPLCAMLDAADASHGYTHMPGVGEKYVHTSTSGSVTKYHLFRRW